MTHAGLYDDQVVEELIGRNQANIRQLFGDKAYVSQALKQLLREQLGIWLYTPKKRNAKTTTQHLTKYQGRQRLTVETINAQLQEQFHFSKHYAKTKLGLLTRVAAKVTAHTMGQVINLILGRPLLALADLAV